MLKNTWVNTLLLFPLGFYQNPRRDAEHAQVASKADFSVELSIDWINKFFSFFSVYLVVDFIV